MRVRRIVAALENDTSAAHPIEAAREVAARLGARLVPVLARPVAPNEPPAPPGWPARRSPQGIPGTIVVQGVPAIEIIRQAEVQSADLIILPRGCGSEVATTGGICDAVIRRAEVPCLVVPQEQRRFSRLVASLDGSDRGMVVLRVACELRRLVEGRVAALHVHPREPLPLYAPAESPGSPAGDLARRMQAAAASCGDVPLVERHGEVVSGVLDGLSAAAGDILVVGVRRGGSAGVSESTGNGRRLQAAAPCAVLTVPL